MANPIRPVLEAVSLAASLSVTFVSIVECFDHLELGPHFGKDLNKAQARLAALKLQITRWGISSGTLPDPQTGRQRVVNVDEHTAEITERLLNHILEDILELEKKPRRYSDPGQPGAIYVVDSMPPDRLNETTQALKLKTSGIFAKRIRGLLFQKKTKWAIYEKNTFDRLLEAITENLALLIPTPQLAEPQRELCRMEVEEVQTGQPQEVIELLHYASKINKDTLLEQAIQEAISSWSPGHSWERTEVDDNVKLVQGDRIASSFAGQIPMKRGNHKFGVTIGKGKTEIHQGDIFGGCEHCLPSGNKKKIHQGDVYGGL